MQLSSVLPVKCLQVWMQYRIHLLRFKLCLIDPCALVEACSARAPCSTNPNGLPTTSNAPAADSTGEPMLDPRTEARGTGERLT